MSEFSMTRSKKLLSIFLMLCLFILTLNYYLYSHQMRAGASLSGISAVTFASVILLNIFSVIVLFRVFRQQRLLESQLFLSRKKMEESILIKDRFMANMSHEIRTPLNAIIGFGSRLNKTELSNEQKEYVHALQHSGDTLLRIINDILDFSSLESGIIKIESQRFDLHETLNGIHTMFRQKAQERNNTLSFSMSNDLPRHVMGDPTRLNQILINIVGNAVKFTRDGKVEVVAEVMNEEKSRINLRFRVSDSGIGIPAQHLDRIFEKLRQEKSDMSRTYGGIGLGLALSKRLTELLGGRIQVKSAEGKGAEFIVEIPYLKAEPEEEKKEMTDTIGEIPPAKRKEINILVVEDNLLNQRLAGFLLKDWGFRYDFASNGILALEKMKAAKFDLVLMDIQMPEMNGYEATQAIRKELDPQIPILAMTAHVLPGEKEKCIGYGMNDYISKPVKDNDLLRMISKYIHANSATNQRISI